MTRGKAHVVGAGLAGLAAAVKLAGEGVQVELSEATAQAGGRCRSYFDPQLGLIIDNGNHLVLSGNRAVADYLACIGADTVLTGPDESEFDFVDLRTNRRWKVRPNQGPVPWWILSRARRPPGTRALDYLGLRKLLGRNPGRRIDQVVNTQGLVWEQLIGPFLLAALNTDPAESSADLASAVLRETLAKGGRAYRPRIAHPSLSAAFVDPALATLDRLGARVRLGRRLRGLGFDGDRVSSLMFADGEVGVASGDEVVLATPPGVAGELIPGFDGPNEFRAIVNAHYRVAPDAQTRHAAAGTMTGVIGGTVEWVFAFENRLSVTVSAADRLVEMEREALAALLWRDVAAVCRLGPELPPWQIVKERRATFAATPAQDARRPDAQTRWSNLILAGDWVQTGLPATIEGALRSGGHAATLALARLFV